MPSRDEYWRNPDKYRKATRDYAKAHPEWKRESNSAWLKTPQGKAAVKEWNRNHRLGLSDEKLEERAAYQREWFSSHPEYNQQKQAHSYKVNPVRHMLYRAKTRAIKQGLPFDLDPDKIEVPNVCPILGVTLEPGTKDSRANSPSLDRLIPALGYIQSNVRVISQAANVVKYDRTLDEMRVYADRLRQQLARADAVIAYLEREL